MILWKRANTVTDTGLLKRLICGWSYGGAAYLKMEEVHWKLCQSFIIICSLCSIDYAVLEHYIWDWDFQSQFHFQFLQLSNIWCNKILLNIPARCRNKKNHIARRKQCQIPKHASTLNKQTKRHTASWEVVFGHKYSPWVQSFSQFMLVQGRSC